MFKIIEKIDAEIEKLISKHRTRIASLSPVDRGVYLFEFFAVAYHMRGNLSLEDCRESAVEAASKMIGEDHVTIESLGRLFDQAKAR
jgi:hypothetical protein